MGRGWCLIAFAFGCRLKFEQLPDADLRPNLVFMTSTQQTATDVIARGGGDIMAGGDAICAEQAAAVGLPGTYLALLSTPSIYAIDRLAGARGWVRLDGLPFADSVDALFGAQRQVFYPILYNETGVAEPTVQALTGTSGDGHFSATYSCQQWSSFLPTDQVFAGNSTDGSNGWSSRYVPYCDGKYRLYCFGMDRISPVTITPQVGRRAFVTSKPWIPSGGLVGADAFCQTEAADHGITGTFLAFLATNTASAASRFSTTGPTWVRLDGIPIAATPDDLFAKRLLTALTLEPDGVTHYDNVVWSGAGDPMAISANQSCTNWTSTATMGRMAIASDGPNTFFTPNYVDVCTIARRLFCFEP